MDKRLAERLAPRRLRFRGASLSPPYAWRLTNRLLSSCNAAAWRCYPAGVLLFERLSWDRRDRSEVTNLQVTLLWRTVGWGWQALGDWAELDLVLESGPGELLRAP